MESMDLHDCTRRYREGIHAHRLVPKAARRRHELENAVLFGITRDDDLRYALAVPLDDPALVVALMLALRSGQFAVTP
jgi:hypothetical protein